MRLNKKNSKSLTVHNTSSSDSDSPDESWNKKTKKVSTTDKLHVVKAKRILYEIVSIQQLCLQNLNQVSHFRYNAPINVMPEGGGNKG